MFKELHALAGALRDRFFTEPVQLYLDHKEYQQLWFEFGHGGPAPLEFEHGGITVKPRGLWCGSTYLPPHLLGHFGEGPAVVDPPKGAIVGGTFGPSVGGGR